MANGVELNVGGVEGGWVTKANVLKDKAQKKKKETQKGGLVPTHG